MLTFLTNYENSKACDFTQAFLGLLLFLQEVSFLFYFIVYYFLKNTNQTMAPRYAVRMIF